mgnify:FL=1
MAIYMDLLGQKPKPRNKCMKLNHVLLLLKFEILLRVIGHFGMFNKYIRGYERHAPVG